MTDTPEITLTPRCSKCGCHLEVSGNGKHTIATCPKCGVTTHVWPKGVDKVTEGNKTTYKARK